jgi:hypothetical protein
MKRSRYRERGNGIRTDLGNQIGYNQSFSYAPTYHWSPKLVSAGDPPVLTDQYYEGWGLEFYFPTPTSWYDKNGWWELNRSDPVYLAELETTIRSQFSSHWFLNTIVGEREPVIVGESHAFMSDVVGSRFRELQGRTFLVNPCTSGSIESTIGAPEDNPGLTTAYSVTLGGSGPRVQQYQFTASFVYPALHGLTAEAYDYVKSLLPAPADLSLANSPFSSATLAVDDAVLELLTSVAEMNKTIDFIVHVLRKIGKIIADTRRGNFKWLEVYTRRRDIDHLTIDQLWLQARYAVRPLMIDIENSIKYLYSDKQLRPLIRKRKFDNDENTSSSNVSFGIGDVSYNLDISSIQFTRAAGGVYAKLVSDHPSVHMLGLTNIAKTAWEVIPWSFVIDWFVNISGLIASFNPNPTYQIVAGYKSVKTETYTVGKIIITSNGTDSELPIKVTSESYGRIDSTSAELFNLDLNLTIPKLVDLLAFMTTRLRS